ncbi:Alpha/Beta hydrolase protein [Elsinoe ampelina]|uniref:Alpha/Beta hydrolase protein n=1 Tax=Elsinoe ampelina TaxID=302913 RepID=A0A6A6G3C2_9PEZI|nr:Alpha/Beta hydrolase protein [Elsinoe ampelina]
MKVTSIILTAFAVGINAQRNITQPAGCPALPISSLGNPIPIKPENIPRGCRDFEILFARGTSEPDFAPDGRYGVVVGDPIYSNLTRVFRDVQGYPVQYPASSANDSALMGATDVIRRLNAQSRACPRQRFALVGYSQGAGVIRLAANALNDTRIENKIVAFVGVGDPARRSGRELLLPPAVGRRQYQICAGTGTPDSDPVCDGFGRGCFFFHLTYIQPANVKLAVDFLVQQFRGAERR